MSIFLFFLVVALIVGFFYYRHYQATHTDTHALIHKEFYDRNWEIIKIKRKPLISPGLEAQAMVYHVAYYDKDGKRGDCNVVSHTEDSLRFYEASESGSTAA